MTMITVKALRRKWIKNPKYKVEYEALSKEFAEATGTVLEISFQPRNGGSGRRAGAKTQ